MLPQRRENLDELRKTSLKKVGYFFQDAKPFRATLNVCRKKIAFSEIILGLERELKELKESKPTNILDA